MDGFIDAVRTKLTLGMPPLTIAEQKLLFEIATGEKIGDRVQCPRCNATGRVEWGACPGCLCPGCLGLGYLEAVR